jgi:hypothetical protein
MESKDPKSTESADAANEGAESKDPKSGATSSETLNEVEKTETAPETNESGGGETEQSPVPSPDGAFDEGRSGGGIEDAGPM